MARTYSAARTVFNRSIKNDVNMRVFEALAAGSLLVTNDLSNNGQAELFRDGVHLAAYRESDDLLDKIAFYLDRESLREKIAAAGRAEVLEKHTYFHRMERLLQEAEEALASVAVPFAAVRTGPGQSPEWGGIIQPGVETPGQSPDRSTLPFPSPVWATSARAKTLTMSPPRGSNEEGIDSSSAVPRADAWAL